ncbi:MAG TPA: polyphosphate:AMP phosphotransferase [Polyangiaceae bacterium]|nr:polyphosphate:AMP phosphotransferase [Polyangiaceae bacterium]
MFESAELGHKITKERYKEEAPALREALLDTQYDLLQNPKFSVAIVIGGVDGAGKGETVNLLHAWMDPRHIHNFALDNPTDEERERPAIWRFWRVLPPKGQTGILLGSWYTTPITKRVYSETKDAELDQEMDQIVRFERMLASEGVLILKFWFHISKKQQKERLKELQRKASTRWRVTEAEWEHFKLYDRFLTVSERALRRTDTAEAPWTIVAGADVRYRSLMVGKFILEAVRKRLDTPAPPPATPHAPPISDPIDNVHVLKELDLGLRLEKKTYEEDLNQSQRRLNLLTREPGFKNISVVVVFEGPDAAGKGGAIRRITGALDARQYRVLPISAPTEEERAQPYLWRFYRLIPGLGGMSVFDRSWYGRVLVERVEELCSEADWIRAYGEINDFEEQLELHPMVIVKFWLQISPEEQLMRFKERAETGFKRYKITPDDWRNREKWDRYERAASDMIDRTSTSVAPWTLVEANDKRYARIKVLQTLCDRIGQAIR